MFRKILRYFFSGTLFIVPLVATAYFFFESFRWLDSLLNLPYPGLGFVIIFAAITLFGYMTSLFALTAVLEWFDHVMNKIPLVKLVYSSVKDLLGAFVGEKKKFDKPVLVTLDAANKIYRIGFAMGEALRDIGLDEMVVVYFPQSYAFAGDHLIVPASSVRHLNISSAAAMKFIVSGGVSGLHEG
ncbi:MAG: DUF502 domain-containing protein [Bacteroidota bacterium]